MLLDLARRADIVFVGEDEAEEAWGLTGGPTAVRRALPEPEVLVVKQGGSGAVAFLRPPAGDRAVGAARAGADGTPQSPGCETTPAQPQRPPP